jgi:hypothetical protein
MNNQIKIIREKLFAYWKISINKNFLEKILSKFAPSYKIKNLTSEWIIIPIKRGKSYINTYSKKIQNPFEIGDIYFEWWKYMFWWLWVYNKYWFTTQVVEWHTIYNTKISWKKIIWKNKFIFKKQVENFFYWSIKIKKRDYEYKIMSKERAFIQMIKEWAEVFKIPENINIKKILKMSEKHTSKRIDLFLRDCKKINY